MDSMTNDEMTMKIKKTDSGIYVASGVILSYPALFKRKKFPGQEGEGKFGGRFMFPEESMAKEIAFLRKEVDAMAKEARVNIAADKKCFRDGALTGKPEDEGYWYLQASESQKPTTIDRSKREIDESADLLYGGAIVAVQFGMWVQNNDFGKRVNANLYGVQFLEHGKRFGKPRPTKDDGFEQFEDDDTDGFDDD
jgi:hypothetical protein